MSRQELYRAHREPPIVAGRVPPHDLDAEAAVLSAILLSREAMDRVLEILRPEHFYSAANGRVYEAATKLAAAGTPIDIVSVASWLRDREWLAQIGGTSYLAQLADATPAVAHVEAHAGVVHEKSRLRQFVAACQRFAAEGYGDVGAVQEFMDEAQATLLAISQGGAEDEDIPTMAEAMCERGSMLLAADGKPRDALKTGLVDLDRKAGPMTPGMYIVVGAHSGVGKTSFAMQLAVYVCDRCSLDGQAAGAYVVSQEMLRQQISDRALSSAMDINSKTIASGLDPIGLQKLASAVERISTSPSGLHGIWIDDRPAVKPEQLHRRARRVASESARRGVRLALIVVDYVQLMDGGDGAKRSHERYEREVAYISKELKRLAQDLRVVVIALAQLNEDARAQNRLPRGEDFAQCKALRHDADRVILIHNEQALARRTSERDSADQTGELPPEVVQLIVDKNRGGEEGMVYALFQPSRSSFADMDPAERRKYIDERRAQREQEQAQRSQRRTGPR